MHRLQNTISAVNAGFSASRLSEVTTAIHSFWLYDLCDIYLETSKIPLSVDLNSTTSQQHTKIALSCLYECVITALKLAHPIMPFITEELYQHLNKAAGKPEECESIMISAFPVASDKLTNESISEQMSIVLSAAHNLNSLRALALLTSKQATPVYIFTKDANLFFKFQHVLRSLVPISAFEVVDSSSARPSGCISKPFTSGDVLIQVQGIIDRETVRTKLAQKLDKFKAKKIMNKEPTVITMPL